MLIDVRQFEENVAEVSSRIEVACVSACRDIGSVRLLPVTKNHPVGAARHAFCAGFRSVGENRVQEALEKIEVGPAGLEWELIGPLQSNKAKRAVEKFARIQTVDRPKIVTSIQRYALERGSRAKVLMQVNAGSDPNKAGVSLAEAESLFELILDQPNIELEGLMTIAPLDNDLAVARRCFAALRECRDKLESRGGVTLPELSMGMSGDLEQAIQEGSTLVRVGTALFGRRTH